jgi:hypothetical protein
VHVKQRMLLRRDLQNWQDFTQTNNAECVPEVCNEFVSIYLAGRQETVREIGGQQVVIDLTRHMCNWMFVNGYTCNKISVI